MIYYLEATDMHNRSELLQKAKTVGRYLVAPALIFTDTRWFTFASAEGPNVERVYLIASPVYGDYVRRASGDTWVYRSRSGAARKVAELNQRGCY